RHRYVAGTGVLYGPAAAPGRCRRRSMGPGGCVGRSAMGREPVNRTIDRARAKIPKGGIAVMTEISRRRRTDSASRVIAASPRTLYRAFLDPDALVRWLPAKGMTGRIYEFEPREGGCYRMALTYDGGGPSIRGKTSEDTDLVEGRFLELIPDARI